MKSLSFIVGIVAFFSLSLIAPQMVYAQVGGAVTVISDTSPTSVNTSKQGTLTAIKSTLTAIHSKTSAVATYAMYLNDYVLQPTAFALSGKMMKSMTASVIKFVNDGAGDGKAQFVTDIRGSMRSAGDAQAFAFFVQFRQNSNSPFASAIYSSLRANYMQDTSSDGFWSGNRCTLSNSSPNVNRFLAGDWSQGGAGAWFALTTQDQNNPYTLYQNSQNQLNSLVMNAQSARTLELNMGQGFLSWCGSSDSALGKLTTSSSALNEAQKAADAAQEAFITASDAAAADPGNPELEGALAQSKAASLAAGLKYSTLNTSSVGASPGDPCTNKDGTPGTIKTPGSVIGASLNKVLGLTGDKLVQMGSVGKEVNGIMKDIGTVVNTANFATELLGGSNSRGLLGVGNPSGTNSRSPIAEWSDPTTGYLGVTSSAVLENNSSGADMPSRIAQYQSAWNTIGTAVDAASASVTELATYCTNSTTVPPIKFVAQAAVANAVLKSDIAPALDQVAKARADIAAATVIVGRINSGTSITKDSDMLELQTMSPTADDVTNAQQNAKSFNTAAADPEGSLAVSADSLFEQMNLITKNAKLLKSACNARFARTAPSALTDAKSRVAQYKSAWDVITAQANDSSNRVIKLENFCSTERVRAQKLAETVSDKYNSYVKFISASDVQEKEAKNQYGIVIAPALDQSTAAADLIFKATARVSVIENQLNTLNPADVSTYNKLTLELQAMSPTADNVVTAQKDAQAQDSGNPAKTDSKFSLVVSGGSLVERMHLLGYQARNGFDPPDDSLKDGVWSWEACDLNRTLIGPGNIGIND